MHMLLEAFFFFILNPPPQKKEKKKIHVQLQRHLTGGGNFKDGTWMLDFLEFDMNLVPSSNRG